MALILYNPLFWAALILFCLILLLVGIRLRLRWWPAWILRVLLVALILMAIFTSRSESIRSAISEREIMIVDLSYSLPQGTRDDFLTSARDWQLQNTDRIILVFGDKSYVSYPNEESWPQVDGRANNLGEALGLASNILGTSPGKVILASDGLIPQSNDLQQAFQTIIDRGQVVDWIPLRSGDISIDGYVGQLWAPRNIWEGMPFYIVLPVFSQVPLEEIGFQVKVNGVNLETTPSLGETYAEFLIPPQNIGIVTIEVSADIPADSFAGNNAAYLTIQVHKEPRVLFVSEDITSSEVLGLLEDMRLNGMVIDQITPSKLPTSLDALNSYQVIFLNNFLASDITQEQMLTLRVFVSRLGGGLVFLGGRNSYTLGGYKNTVLEPMLPVILQPPERTERPAKVFVLVLDRSGSMGEEYTGTTTPIDLAREAAMRAMEKLQANDYLGVLTFNASFTWDVPLRQVGSGLQLREALDAVSRVVADDGTKMYLALNEAISQASNLPESAPSSCSLLLLSDGDSNDGSLDLFSDLAKTAQSESISISTIAFGRADEQIMQAIAQNGIGRYYRVLEAGDLPRVMIQESEAIRGENIQQGETNLVMSNDNPDHPILTGLSLNLLPLINNYNALTSKSDEGAEDVLISANFGDPILSVWQYGLGRVVAWMSDAGEEWTGRWPSSNTRGAFWSQVVRYAIPQPDVKPANVEITAGDVNLKIEATIMDDSIPDVDRYLNLVEVKFSYADTSAEIHTYILPQIAPGRYQLEIPRPESGAYRAVLEYKTSQGENRLIPVLFEVNTPREWLPVQQGETELVNMDATITATGGKKISMGSLPSPIEENTVVIHQATVTKIDWRWYILLALIILWPVEIIIRRRWLPWM